MRGQGNDEPGQGRRVSHLSRCDEEYGRRMAQGLGIPVSVAPTAETTGVR